MTEGDKSIKYALGIEIGGQTAAFGITNEVGTFVYKKKGIPTRVPVTPEEAMGNIFKAVKETGYQIDRVGVACFGPLDLHTGRMGSPPKPAWAHYPIAEKVQEAFPGARVVIETDVNAPAYSEYLALREKEPELRSVAYATIGTGVGVGIFCDGHPIHGLMHPECGHLLPRRTPGDDFEGVCPFHNDCVEGLIAAPAISARLGIQTNQLRDIPDDHIVWKYFADYAGQMCASLALAYSLDVLVVGGGICTAPGREYLVTRIQEVTNKLLNGYIKPPRIIHPVYGQDAGLVGATAVALHPDIFDLK